MDWKECGRGDRLMINLKASRFRVSHDDDNYHVFTRCRNEYKEVTNQLSGNEKDELIDDLIYCMQELMKNDKLNTQVLEKILEEINDEKALLEDDSSRESKLLDRHWNNCLDVISDIIKNHMDELSNADTTEELLMNYVEE